MAALILRKMRPSSKRCEDSGRRRCYGNWGTQTSRIQGTTISKRLVAKRSDASPKIFTDPFKDSGPQTVTARCSLILPRALTINAAVPTVRIFDISYRRLSTV